MSLYSQILDLEQSLEPFKPESPVDWRIGKMANAMIAEAKQVASGNAVIEAIEPFEQAASGSYVASATAGSVRAVLRQLAGAVPSDPPYVA